jgi:DNA-binding Lrp family transcriptional regulator
MTDILELLVRDSVDEVDLALVNAVQVTPRASWTRLGRALGIDAATAARRWQRLHESGLAWVTCVVGPARHGTFCMAYLELDCAPGSLDELAARLTELDRVLYVHHLTGRFPLLAVLARPDPAAVAEYLRERIEPLPGLRDYRCELRTVGYSEPSRWRLRSLEPAQWQALEPEHEPAGPRGGVRIDAVDQQLYELLREDGRMAYTELARRARISEPTARRRVNRLLTNRALRLRCDIAQPISGAPVTAVIWASVPASALAKAGATLAALPQVRLCCALTGPRNLLLMVWLRDPREMPELELILRERAPELTVLDRAICLRTLKQMGRLLDAQGRCIGYRPAGVEAFPAS